MISIQIRTSPRANLTSVLCGLACLIGCWIVVPSKTMAQSTVQRDSQALAIISQAIATVGSQDLLNSIQDFTETGTVTYYTQDQVTGDATIKTRGSNQFRVDANLSTGLRTIVVSANSGAMIDAGGSSRPISGQSAADLPNIMSPYQPLIAAIQDSSISIFYGGLVTHNGISAYDIRIQNSFTAAQDPDGTRGAREARDFYIDSNALLVIAVSDQIHFGSDDMGLLHEIDYSNYQAEAGVLMPLGVSESVGGTLDCSITIGQVVFNSGLTDNDFSW